MFTYKTNNIKHKKTLPLVAFEFCTIQYNTYAKYKLRKI